MNQKCTNIFVVLFFFFISICVAQEGFEENKPFLKHLSTEQLYEEKLFLLSTIKDSGCKSEHHLELGWTYHQLKQLELAQLNYNLVSHREIKDYGYDLDYGKLLFVNTRYNELKEFLAAVHTNPGTENRLPTALNLMMLKYTLENKSEIPQSLFPSYSKYYKSQHKYGAVAGLYSALLPGLGKFYISRNREGINMLLINIVFGLQAYESYDKNGISSPRFIVFGGTFTLFYVANIMGSIWGVRKMKKDYKEQLHYEIYNNYLSNYNLYPNR